MKTLLINLVVMFLCMACCLPLMAQDKAKSKLKGLWNYSLPDAPYEYQKGTIEFSKAEGVLSAEVKFDDRSVTIKEIKKDGEKYTCSLFVDGTDVKVTFKPEVEKITGTVIADGWEMPITLTPKK